jgi:hypothetical protein
MHIPLTVFFIWPLVVVFPPFPNFQNKTELFIYIYIYTIYIYIFIDSIGGMLRR